MKGNYHKNLYRLGLKVSFQDKCNKFTQKTGFAIWLLSQQLPAQNCRDLSENSLR